MIRSTIQYSLIETRDVESYVSILNKLYTLGGSGSSSAPAPSGAPARARVGEEDPAAIRLRFTILV